MWMAASCEERRRGRSEGVVKLAEGEAALWSKLTFRKLMLGHWWVYVKGAPSYKPAGREYMVGLQMRGHKWQL